MTCAQEEVVNTIAFPDGVGPWESPEDLKELDADQTARERAANFSRMVWGEDYPQSVEWRAQDPFDQRCIPDP